MNLKEVEGAKGNTERSACRRLRTLASKVRPNLSIVELGAYRGRTTGWLALGSSEGNGAPVFAVDPWDLKAPGDWPDGYADHLAFDTYAHTHDDWRRHMDRCGAVVGEIRGFAVSAGREWSGPRVGLLYHDAEHSASAVTADLDAWLPHMAPRSTIAIHDACNPRFGVPQGAAAVLDTPDWDWENRRVYPWHKRPDRRGLLVVERC